MRDKVKKSIMLLKQMQEFQIGLSKYNLNSMNCDYYQGKAHAFAEAVGVLTDILNSENPNSVSNQPTEE